MPKKSMPIKDDDYIPCRSYRHRKGVRKSFGVKTDLNHNKWTPKENTAYFDFLVRFQEVLESPDKRKKEKIFMRMSSCISTRQPDQCRSHHQKMLKFHQSFQGVLNNLRKRISESEARNSNEDEQQDLKYIGSDSIDMDSELIGKPLINSFSFDSKGESSLQQKPAMDLSSENLPSEQIWEVISENFWRKS